MISVDLDRASTLHLLRTYFTAKRMFPSVPVEVYVSPSGVGFHLKIRKKVSVLENLKFRALLWDDPVRLSYALKKWALNPDERYVDLVFDEKDGGKEKRIDLEGMLEPYKGDVEKIQEFLQSGETEKADSLVKEVAEHVAPNIQGMKKNVWVCCITFNGDDLREKLEKICGDIAAKDETFKWRMYPNFMPEWDWMLVIFTDNKDLGWRRLVWLKNKTPLKDADTRMWCKARIAT